MKRTLTNLLFILLTSPLLFGQTDFQKGYIVKNNGDTLYGYVNYRKEAQNYTSCNFKRFEIALPVTYTPEKLKAYGIDGGKQYLSVRLNDKPVFVEYLVKGKISLLYYNIGSQHFYIRKDNEKLTELRSGKTLDPASNQTYNHFKDYLTEKLKPCDMNELIQDSKLEVKSLTAVIQKYNQLSNSSFEVPVRRNDKSLLKDYSLLRTNRVRFGLLGGASMISFTPNQLGSDQDFWNKANFNSIQSPLFGVFFKTGISSRSSRLAVQTNFMYQKISLYGFSQYKPLSYSPVLSYNDIFMHLDEIKLQALFHYAIGASRFKISPHIGLGYNVLLNSDYYRFNEMYNTQYNIVQSFEYKGLRLSSYAFSYIGGISFEYAVFSARILTLNVDYEIGQDKVKGQTKPDRGDGLVSGAFGAINLTLGLTL